MTYDEAKKEFINILNKLSKKYSTKEVFKDFVKMAGISIANAARLDTKREDEYFSIIKKYEKSELDLIFSLFSLVVQALSDRFGDFLGECYMETFQGNKGTGQFFTPYSVSRTMAKITFNKETVDKAIEERGFIGLHEPCCGSGGLIVAFLEEMKENGYNFQNQCLVYANDIDERCFYMTYVTLSLLGCPAVVTLGDTLTLKTSDRLFTLFYLINYEKFNRKQEERHTEENEDKNGKNYPKEENAPITALKPLETQLSFF